jgi:ATP-dependent Clp protease adaptor protein ClpS
MASESASAATGGGTAVEELASEKSQTSQPWVTVVWDDPVNLMSYVTHVFSTYFSYPKDQAERLMMQVHMEGRAIVSCGGRDCMERDVQAMHSYGLWATLDKAE